MMAADRAVALAGKVAAAHADLMQASAGSGLVLRRHGLVLDLAEVLGEVTPDTRGLDLYCDTLIWPAGLVLSTEGGLKRVRLVARRIATGEGAVLHLPAAQDDDAGDAVQMLVGHVEGPDLEVTAKGHEPHAFVGALTQRDGTARPQAALYRAAKGTIPSVTVPIGHPMLAAETAFHKVCEMSFALAVEILAQRPLGVKEAEAARDILQWLTLWNGRAPALGSLMRDAHDLLARVPLVEEKAVIPQAPELAAEEYVEAARAMAERARETDLRTAIRAGTAATQQTTLDMVGTFIKRDIRDIDVLNSEIANSIELADTMADVARAAGQQMVKLGSDERINKVRLEGELEMHRVDVIIKASFELMGALAEIGMGFAAMYAGMPPSAKGGPGKVLDNSNTFFNDVKYTDLIKANGSFKQSAQALGMLTLNYLAIPFMLTWDGAMQGAGTNDSESRFKRNSFRSGAQQAGKGALAAKSAISTLASAGAAGKIADDAMAEIEGLLAMLAEQDGPLEAGVHWETARMRSVNLLDPFIADTSLSSGVRSTCSEIKTNVESTCIQGAHLAELGAAHMAQTAKVCALIQERDNLHQSIADMKALQASGAVEGAQLDVLAARQWRALARKFCLSAQGFTDAYTFRALSSPTLSAVLPADVDAMDEALDQMQADFDQLTKDSRRSESAISPTIALDDPVMLDKLIRDGTAVLDMRTDKPAARALDGYDLARLEGLEVRLLGPIEHGPVRLTLISGATVENRKGASVSRFGRAPLRVVFEYEADRVVISKRFAGLLPSPFAKWTLAVASAPDLDLTVVTGVELRLKGHAVV